MSAPGMPPAELLLGRPERRGRLQDAAAWLRGRRVLITGAGGSVGAPLSRQVLAAEPEALVLLDHHEYSLFSLERALAPASASLSYELMDVRDGTRLRRLFERWQPEVIFHLAAAKHVPYGERFPDNVVACNVLSTEALLRLADAAGTEVLVYPSSDKSVTPPSLYGATKRLCEALVQKRAASRRWVVARFVNIIGTRGSVIETFTDQLKHRATLTVTDERMTRYWISMEEALWLLLRSGERGAPGEVLMPDCGDPIPVVETARRLAGWYCPDTTPYPIRISGIRPGERLHEVLLSANEWREPTEDVGISPVRTRRPAAALDLVAPAVERLRRLVEDEAVTGVVAEAMEAATALQ